ncbi:LysM peptidoglycan-binding domain-containing protein [Streptomyces sp. NPDC018045]|uniref:LysM peptidoglycan-binding domain-containing protein n=1 Tax=Streptomyces sp. NPDC018045 TaxID=3365037 RepID=UPI00379C11E5
MSQVSKVLSVAFGEVGYQAERAPGERPSGHQKYSGQVPGLEWSNYQPWCATWVSWVAMKAGVADLFPRTASVYTAMEWFKARGRWSEFPAIGSQIIYGTSGSTHTGLCYAYDSQWIYTVEGNTSLANNANGNKVMKRQRLRRDAYVHGYGLPAYAEGITTADPALKGRLGFTFAATASAPATSSGDSTASGSKYKIKRGQTLGGIAALLGVTLASLLMANPQIKDPDRVDEGQEINVPTKPSTPPSKPTAPPAKPEPSKPASKPTVTTGDFYTVRKGDSLSGIARATGQSLSALLARNPQITNPNLITAGQEIRVKGGAPAVVRKPKVPAPSTSSTATPTKKVAPTPVSPPKATTSEPEKKVTVIVKCACTCDCCGTRPAPRPAPPATGPTQDPKPTVPTQDPKPTVPQTAEPTPDTTVPGQPAAKEAA